MSGLLHSAIDSPRLSYVPATAELTEADLAGPEALATALGVSVPPEWPPELYSRPALMAVKLWVGVLTPHFFVCGY